MGAGDGKEVPGSLYFYGPNKGAAIWVTIAWAATALWHLYQCMYVPISPPRKCSTAELPWLSCVKMLTLFCLFISKFKAFKVTGLYPFTCLLFVVGFALRSYEAFHYGDVNIFIASNTLIYMAPPLVELANYHILGRILYFVPYFAPIHPGRTLTTFGTISALVEVLNALGVAWMVNPNIPDDIKSVGEVLLKASLIIQIAVIVFFVSLVAAFQHRCAKKGGRDHARRIRPPIVTLYLSSALVMIRCIYRTVEYFGEDTVRQPGMDPMSLSPIVRYEWFFYVFEGVVMLVNSSMWNLRHPRLYLPQDHRVYLAQDGRTELVGDGYKDNRHFLITLLDPFGWLLKDDSAKQTPFWETNGFGKDGRNGSQSMDASARGLAAV